MREKMNSLGQKQMILALVCAIVVTSMVGVMYYFNNFNADSIIGFDVNPSIEIVTNKKDEVLYVDAINADGEEVLGNMDLSNADLDVAVNAIIGAMVQHGYILDEESQILVTVYNEDEDKAQEVKTKILDNLNETLKNNEVNADVINQVIGENKESNTSVSEFANEYGISFGKATFIMKLIEKDPTLSSAELAKCSIREIVAIILERGINIEDIIDYDDDDSLYENVEDAIDDDDDRYDYDDDDRYDDDDDDDDDDDND